jgi:hypothetical protein
MEKIMKKTNNTESTRELTEAELDAVTGGAFTSFASFGDIKGEPTDKDHRDWVMNLVDRI